MLQRESAEWLDWVQTAHAIDGQSHRVFGTLSYAAQTWGSTAACDRQGRTFVGRRRRQIQSPLCGDQLGRRRAGVVRGLYCQRGDSENRIKEQQLGLFADRTSCHAFVANTFRVLLAAAAYVLVEHIRRTALVGTELEKAEVGTIRLRLFRVAGLVVKSVRRLVVRLAASFVGQDVFRVVAQRLQSRCGTDSS